MVLHLLIGGPCQAIVDQAGAQSILVCLQRLLFLPFHHWHGPGRHETQPATKKPEALCFANRLQARKAVQDSIAGKSG